MGHIKSIRRSWAGSTELRSLREQPAKKVKYSSLYEGPSYQKFLLVLFDKPKVIKPRNLLGCLSRLLYVAMLP